MIRISNTTPRRNIGIDLLRVIAAFYAIILHILGIGGLQAAASGTGQTLLCNALSMWCYCAVNIFGIITGFVGYTEEARPLKLKNYLRLWREVVFYNLLLTALTLWLRPGSAKLSNLLTACFPLLAHKSWYFTGYTAVFFLIPFLNAAVRNLDNNYLLILLALIVFGFTTLEVYLGLFICNGGYSFTWLMILYIVGAILRKTDLGSRIHPTTAFLGIVGVFLIAFVMRNLSAWWCYPLRSESALVVDTYIFPGHLLIAILYTVLFAQLRPGKPLWKFAAFAAPGAFAVYLINTQHFVWFGYMGGHFAPWASLSPVEIGVRVMLTAVVFTLVSLGIDWLRRQLFRCLEKVGKRSCNPAQG